MKTNYPSYCCQKCGELIGWIGRVLPFHKCKEKNMNPLPRYNEKGEPDTRLRVDPVTGDVGIGTPKEKEHMTKDEIIEMAKQSGCYIRNGHIYNQYIGSLDQVLKKFAKLVAEKEREACAELIPPQYFHFRDWIRARGQE